MAETTLDNAGQVESNLEETATIEELTTEIQLYLGKIGQNIIEIGKRLVLAKAKLPHGEWRNWLKDNFNLSKSTANNFMRCAERFSNFQTSGNLNPSQMVEMLSLPAEETEKFISEKSAEGMPVESMSVKKLREEVKKYNLKLSGTDGESDKNSATIVEDLPPKTVTVEVVTVESEVNQDESEIGTAEEISKVKSILPLNENEKPPKILSADIEEIQPIETGSNTVYNDSADDETTQDLVQLFKLTSSLLNKADLQNALTQLAKKDLQNLEMQLSQLNALQTELKNYAEVCKNSGAVSDDSSVRRAVIAELQKICLCDDKNFTKTKIIDAKVESMGFENVHQVPTKELIKILEEVGGEKNENIVDRP